MSHKHKRRFWNDEEEERLKNFWGNKPVDQIALSLGRSPGSVRDRARQLGLRPWIEMSEYLTMNQVTQALGVGKNVARRHLIPEGLPVTRQNYSGSTGHLVVRHELLLEWLKEHPDLYDSRKIRPYALGIEPDWLQEKRRYDGSAITKPRRAKYTAEEDIQIARGRVLGRTYKEIGAAIGRSARSVQSRADKKRL